MITNILDYLERSAERFPDKIAFGDTKREITYRQLVCEAKAIGTLFASYGFRKKPIVVVTDHTVECLVTFLGIVYSGNFYVPVDGKLPSARIQAILSVSQPQVIVAPQKEADRFADFTEDAPILVREELEKTKINDKILAQIRRGHLDTDPLYLIFTSGSTGIPKGVLVCHRSVIDLAEQFADTFEFDENEVFANQAPFDFDVSVKDIYSTLRNGASLYIVPQAMFSMPKSLLPYLNDHKVSTVIWAVSALSVLSAMRVLDKGTPQYLKKVMFSGEVMPVKVLNYWREHLPETMFVNLYGPTEITCNCTYYIVDRVFSGQEALPIGEAFKNTEILLLNEDGTDTAPGETGEICVRGTCLAHGYYRNPEATSRAFRQNPRNSAYPELIYHTGDYGRYNGQGQLMFASRRDWQIKHMGHRIELAEIESTVNAFSWVTGCCCQYDEAKGKIVLIYETEEACDKRILQELQNYLPKYMCPNRLIWMKKMPLNQRGKIDRVFLKQKCIAGNGLENYKEAVLYGENKEVEALLNEQGLSFIRIEREEQLWKFLAQTVAPTRVYLFEDTQKIPQAIQDNPYLRFMQDVDAEGGV
ncbi:MAG: amino acid adenylation domain-containing protein [Marvinbryantia sp.]|jgi:D-alanine--poly(phosphoribitol) ligase subunit 1